MTNVTRTIHNWYRVHKRQLPWRQTNDPYRIWMSEIIMQQTQVAQGLSYYYRFLEAFPHVASLAAASETQVLQLWQGLGYYSRARNMHQAAKTIVTRHNGKFPPHYKELLALKGIGSYTAAAIASIAFDLPYAVIDGNVFRLLSRLFAIDTPVETTQGKKQFKQLADELLDKSDPSTHNQAMMEMGALICKPANPQCAICPLTPYCKAFAAGTQLKYPVKAKRTLRKKRYLNFIVIIHQQQIALQKRTDNDIWKGLYQLPLIETEAPPTGQEMSRLVEKAFNRKITVKPLRRIKHLLTHQELHLSFFRAVCPQEQKLTNPFPYHSFEMVQLSDLNNYPFPQPVKTFLRDFISQ
jgi:A/G-specific adenine glycosylase